MCIVAAPEGVDVIKDHPEVDIYFLQQLIGRSNKEGYIVPGLGDAGDRLFGTK